MKLFLKSGYVNMEYIKNMNCTFNIVYGGRGTGKTYGTLKMCLEDKHTIMLTRRTQTQLDIINKKDFSPYLSLSNDLDFEFVSQSVTKYNTALYYAEMDEESGKLVPTGFPFAYTSALSTFSNIRGFDASYIQDWVYDEFIPELHERPIKDEADAFFNAYETMNRNRELKGLPPIKVYLLSNSNRLSSPIFLKLNIVDTVSKMKMSGERIFVDRKRSLAIFDLEDSPISVRKQETALYKLAESNSSFAQMALRNQFFKEGFGNIRSRNLKEFTPVVSFGEITIYQHKNRNEWYVSMHGQGAREKYEYNDANKKRFLRKYYYIWDLYLENLLEFESPICEMLLTEYLK